VIVNRLQIDGLRNLSKVDLALDPGINFFYGLNGAGKTSVLEAAHILATGRSFRVGQPRDMIQYGQSRYQIVAHCQTDAEDPNSTLILGLQRSLDDWTARINGDPIERISDLATHLVALSFHPSSHELIEGGPERRRQYLDYTMFHVEHTFLTTWRNYRKVLKHRNACIRQKLGDDSFDYWEGELARYAALLTKQREAIMQQLQEVFSSLSEMILGDNLSLAMQYQRGWKQDADLLDVLLQQRRTDRQMGYTRSGPHRADIRLSLSTGKVAPQLSRGQQKSLALILLMSQLSVIQAETSHRPLILLDDFPSELDVNKQAACLDRLSKTGCQILITGVDPPGPGLKQHSATVFHVEHGQIHHQPV